MWRAVSHRSISLLVPGASSISVPWSLLEIGILDTPSSRPIESENLGWAWGPAVCFNKPSDDLAYVLKFGHCRPQQFKEGGEAKTPWTRISAQPV